MRKDSDVKAGRIATTAIAVAAAAVVILPATTKAAVFANLGAAAASASGTAVTVTSNSGPPPEVVTISNVLNVSATNGFNLDVQDSSGGVELFRFPTSAFATPSTFTPAVGDVIDVTATNSPFNGNNEFSNVAASVTLDHTGTFTPTAIKTTQANDAFAGVTPADKIFLDETVTLNNVTITPVTANQTAFAQNGTYDATDAFGTTLLFINAATSASAVGAFIGQNIPTGPVNVTGFVDWFSTGSEIEINPTAIVAAPEPAALGLLAAAGTLMAIKRRGRRA
jgi:hypothetical protein